MSSLRSSMVNVINRTGYEAVKAKSISLHEKRTQIKCIEPHAPRETHRHSQNGSAQRVGTLCLPCPPSFPPTISKSCFHGIPYTHICNQPIYLSIYIYMGLLFTFFLPSALFKLKSHSSGCPSLAIFYRRKHNHQWQCRKPSI